MYINIHINIDIGIDEGENFPHIRLRFLSHASDEKLLVAELIRRDFVIN
jgi:hypothetical protein